jgi:hypothetical protein
MGPLVPSKDPEKRREATRRWREKHPEQERERKRAYLQSDHGKAVNAAYMKTWRERNPERSRELRKRWRDKARLECLTHYGGEPPSCACCGEIEMAFLCLDHINGNGNEERRKAKHGRGAGPLLYASLRKQGWPEGYRVLCWNCNAAHGLYGACPHQSKTEVLPMGSVSRKTDKRITLGNWMDEHGKGEYGMPTDRKEQ